MIDSNVVTWGQFEIILAFIGMVATGILGFGMRQIVNIGRRVDTQRDLIEANNREMMRYYATQEMVTQVEKRLSETLNTMVEQITDGMSQMTSRIEMLFNALLHDRAKRD